MNPDILIVCQPIKKAYLDFPPSLIVEILSPATALKDRHTKFDIYQQQQIPYYLLVDVDQKEVEVYRLNEQKVYEKIEVDQKASTRFSFSDCNLDIVLDDIWS